MLLAESHQKHLANYRYFTGFTPRGKKRLRKRWLKEEKQSLGLQLLPAVTSFTAQQSVEGNLNSKQTAPILSESQSNTIQRSISGGLLGWTLPAALQTAGKPCSGFLAIRSRDLGTAGRFQ